MVDMVIKKASNEQWEHSVNIKLFSILHSCSEPEVSFYRWLEIILYTFSKCTWGRGSSKKNSIFVMRIFEIAFRDVWWMVIRSFLGGIRGRGCSKAILDLLIDAIWSAKMPFYIFLLLLSTSRLIQYSCFCQHVAAPCTQFYIYFFRCFTHHGINEDREKRQNVFLIMYFLFFFEFLTNICILFYFHLRCSYEIWKECGNGRERYVFSYIE